MLPVTIQGEDEPGGRSYIMHEGTVACVYRQQEHSHGGPNSC